MGIPCQSVGLTKGLIESSFNQSGFNPFITLLSFPGLRPCGKPIPVKAFHLIFAVLDAVNIDVATCNRDGQDEHG